MKTKERISKKKESWIKKGGKKGGATKYSYPFSAAHVFWLVLLGSPARDGDANGSCGTNVDRLTQKVETLTKLVKSAHVLASFPKKKWFTHKRSGPEQESKQETRAKEGKTTTTRGKGGGTTTRNKKNPTPQQHQKKNKKKNHPPHVK